MLVQLAAVHFVAPLGLVLLCLLVSSAVNGDNWHGFKKK